MPTPRTIPAWLSAVRCWARQTSTRSGLVFVAISAAGVSLTDDQMTAIVAVAGAIAAVIALICPDRPTE